MTTSKVRLWVGGTAALCVLLLVAAWFLLVSPQRAEAAELEQSKLDNDAANVALRAKIGELEAQYAQLPQRKAELAAVRLAMPEDPQLPRLVRDLDALAAEAGVDLVSVSPADPVSLAPAGAAAAAPVAPPVEGAAPADDAAAAEGAAPAPTAPAASPVVLAQITTAVVVEGEFFAAQLFLQKVQEQMERDLLVTSVVLGDSAAGDAEAGDVSMTLTGMAFVLRTQSSPQPAAAPAAPVGPANG